MTEQDAEKNKAVEAAIRAGLDTLDLDGDKRAALAAARESGWKP